MTNLKNKIMLALPVATLATGNIVSFAEGTTTADAALTSGATNAISQVTANINAVVPIALGLLGLVMSIKIGIRVFKSITRESAG